MQRTNEFRKKYSALMNDFIQEVLDALAEVELQNIALEDELDVLTEKYDGLENSWTDLAQEYSDLAAENRELKQHFIHQIEEMTE